jgi:hypothetical protein
MNIRVGQLLLDGIETTNPGARFAAYSRILRELSGDVPIITLFGQDDTVTISRQYRFVGLNRCVLDGTIR